MSRDEVADFVSEFSENALLCDGLEEAFVGVSVRFGQEPIACYDYNKVLKIFMKDGMTEEEAVEYFDYNVIGAWVGEQTPCFINCYSPTEIETLRASK